MQVTSLDAIVKNILIKKGYSLHWYIDFLVYAKDCLLELSLDEDIQTIRRAILPIDQDTFRADLPIDFLDYAKIFARTDQYMRPLVEDNSLDLIPNYDSDFVNHPYSDGVQTQLSVEQNSFFPSYNSSNMWWMVNWNSYGENLGRQFGGTGSYIDTFRIDWANKQIKVNERLFATEIGIEYIGDGMDADSATHITVYAKQTIELFCYWQLYLNNRTYTQAEADDMEQKYLAERVRLRARLSDLTIEKLKRSVQKNTIRIKY